MKTGFCLETTLFPAQLILVMAHHLIGNTRACCRVRYLTMFLCLVTQFLLFNILVSGCRPPEPLGVDLL
jgi:hypothetical protein